MILEQCNVEKINQTMTIFYNLEEFVLEVGADPMTLPAATAYFVITIIQYSPKYQL